MLTSLRVCQKALAARGYASVASAAPVYISKEQEAAIPRGQLESYPQVGKREWVGHGRGGMPNYFDCLSFPYPAIRFREWDSAYEALRQKEKGDWKNLSLEEKKQIYRNSFRYTLAEVQAPTGRWKLSLGYALLILSLGSVTLLTFRKLFMPEFPKSFDEEWLLRSMYKQVMIGFNPVQGVGSKFDYENNRWKE